MSKFKVGDMVKEKGETDLGTIISMPDKDSQGQYEVAFSEGTLFLSEDDIELNAEEGQPPVPKI